MAKDLNKVQLIGNVAKDVELRHTQTGSSVCGFSVATNRTWLANGQKKEETQYHQVVAWGKLAEICAKFVKKGTKLYVSGRMSTRSYDKDGEKRFVTEVVMEDMILLSPKQNTVADAEEPSYPQQNTATEEVDTSDIPF